MKTVEKLLERDETSPEVDRRFSAITASLNAGSEYPEDGENQPSADLVDASAARERIKTWNDNGVSLKTVSKLSGVSSSTLSRILYGRPTEGIKPQAQISLGNSNRILGVDISEEHFTGKIDATGTLRRVQALAALGFTGRIVYETAGIGADAFWALGDSGKVIVSTARSIKSAYETLRDTLPPMATPGEKGLVTRTKARAVQEGWFPPASWNDATIDDPLQGPLEPIAEKPSTPAPQAPTTSLVQETIRDCQCKRVRHEHGTHNAYLTDKCRCLPCKKANAAASVHNRKMKAYGRGPNTTPVDAKPVQKHIKKLMRNGWGVERIAKEAGVGTSTVSRILYGEPARKIRPPKTVLGKTSDKILAFNPEKREQRQGTVIETVDSTGTKRRIQALVACGYSMTRIADEMGTYKQAITLIMKGERVLLSTAESYKDIYDKLWDVPPPRETPAEKKAYTTAKKMAEENGWFPPMAWDDDLIDDPKHKAAA